MPIPQPAAGIRNQGGSSCVVATLSRNRPPLTDPPGVFQRFKIENIQIDTVAVKNIAVAFWNDDSDVAINDYLKSVFEVDPQDFPERLRETRACFVTLRRRRALRGCLGALEASRPSS